MPGAPGQGERDLRGDEPDQELPAGAPGGAARRGHGRRVRRHHQQGGGYLCVTFTFTYALGGRGRGRPEFGKIT